MQKHVVVIGGGIAGMESAGHLARMGFNVTLLEKEPRPGGHLAQWDRLFPNKRKSSEVIDAVRNTHPSSFHLVLDSKVTRVERDHKAFTVHLDSGTTYKADAVILATGFDLFDARKKEEYGYGIYDHVVTSADLEKMFAEKQPLVTAAGLPPKRIGLVHCVGSRDEKAGNLYCSRVCCVTGVKQAIELKEILPETEIFCFYMDLRMFDLPFEALYLEAQEKWGIQFVRGRLSEASENKDGSILVKVEDTLLGKPLKMSVDLLVLLSGMVPSEATRNLGRMMELDFDANGFPAPADEHTSANLTKIPGVFLAGTCTSPKSVKETLADARAAAVLVAEYMQGINNQPIH